MRLFVSGSAPLLIETFKQRRGGTVGFALSGVSLRVHDEPVQPVPIVQIGGIQLKCPNVFKDYWRTPEKTAEEFAQAGFLEPLILARSIHKVMSQPMAVAST